MQCEIKVLIAGNCFRMPDFRGRQWVTEYVSWALLSAFAPSPA